MKPCTFYDLTPTDLELKSWNPLAMCCTPVSPGCANCWHIAFAKRHANNPGIPEKKRRAYAGGTPHLDLDELEAPLRLKKPAIIAVQYMGDLGHTDIDLPDFDKVLQVMAEASHHKFLLLTKRICRLGGRLRCSLVQRPLPNVALGASVCTQPEADKIIPNLLGVPAAMRWISVEPMLGEIDLRGIPVSDLIPEILGWVVCGGEKHGKPRYMDLDWARSLRDQCAEAGVPYYFKQVSGRNNAECAEIPDDLMVRQLPEWMEGDMEEKTW